SSVDGYLVSMPALVDRRHRRLWPVVRERQTLVNQLQSILRDLGLEWTCPRPANTPDVGVSPRGGCSDAEEGGGQGSESPTTAIVHAVVQGRGRRLGATG